MKTLWIAGIVCSLGSSGCLLGSSGGGGSGGSDGSDGSSDEADDDGSASVADGSEGGAHAELAQCRGDATDDEVIDTIAITDAYRDSLHEMVVCGGLAVQLCAAIIEGVIVAIQNASDDATPPAWSYDAGVYRTSGSGVQMEARFFYAEDFAVGTAGEQVQHNLFLVDSYLVDAELVIDVFTGESEIRYDEPGPLVELLGFGADPANPLPITFAHLADIENRLSALEFESVIVLDDERDTGTIRYHLATPRQPAGALLGGAGLRFDLEEADGERAALDQELVVDSWNVEYTGNKSLDGVVEFHVDGRHFPFAGTMIWDRIEYPERTLSCP
jgi:hypothetical protein